MHTHQASRVAQAIFSAGLVAACAASGPGYREVTAGREPVAGDQTRVVFMRPRDRDDAGNGGRAVVRLGQQRIGGLAYGGFFFVDVSPGLLALGVSGRYTALGSCEVRVQTTGGETLYVDVGPRMSYMLASLAGSLAGGLAGAAATPAAVMAPGESVVVNSGAASVAAGSLAGETAAQTIERQGKPCSGPYQVELLAEDLAMIRLQGLAWSQ